MRNSSVDRGLHARKGTALGKIKVQIKGQLGEKTSYAEGDLVLVMSVDGETITTILKGSGSIVNLLGIYGRLRVLVANEVMEMDPTIDKAGVEVLLVSAEEAAEEVYGKTDVDRATEALRSLLGL